MSEGSPGFGGGGGYYPLERLEEAGIPLEGATEEQRQLLATMHPEEVETVIRLHKRQRLNPDLAASVAKGDTNGYAIF